MQINCTVLSKFLCNTHKYQVSIINKSAELNIFNKFVLKLENKRFQTVFPDYLKCLLIQFLK